MSGVDDLMPRSNDRWADAARRAQGAPAVKLGRIDVLLSLEDGERKDIRRQVLGKSPLDPDRLAVSRAAAVQLRKNLATQLIWMSVYPFVFLPQVIRGDGFTSWLMAGGVALLLTGTLFIVRDFQRAGGFLARTAEFDASDAAG